MHLCHLWTSIGREGWQAAVRHDTVVSRRHRRHATAASSDFFCVPFGGRAIGRVSTPPTPSATTAAAPRAPATRPLRRCRWCRQCSRWSARREAEERQAPAVSNQSTYPWGCRSRELCNLPDLPSAYRGSLSRVRGTGGSVWVPGSCREQGSCELCAWVVGGLVPMHLPASLLVSHYQTLKDIIILA